MGMPRHHIQGRSIQFYMYRYPYLLLHGSTYHVHYNPFRSLSLGIVCIGIYCRNMMCGRCRYHYGMNHQQHNDHQYQDCLSCICIIHMFDQYIYYYTCNLL